MDRAIKFRAFDDNDSIEPPEMLYFDLNKLHSKRGEDGVWQGDKYLSLALHHLPLMQFTGLTDKNGIEIYEGDRISLWNFYKASGTTAEWFGAEPQNSKYVYEEYLETMEAEVVFIDGSFVAKNANHEIPLMSVVKGLGEEVSWHYMCGMGGSEKEFIEGFIDDWEHYYDELESLEEESFYKRLEEIVNEITTEIKVIGNIYELK